ncbi:hypothetical protein CANARDRAFT_5535 [[Candida] arabinofermentans NRRL YB-2248]|uniref:Glucose-6-phosphate 1-epimerase n=1 Tax=[Candida] arabinofermentans NRRL YB-2248 TaxID=983967 RepID=A0A1E4T933_9ASCO|nr:hypothetical protein CANARDRAFT_5535 [[Candida] arabinofermentans NRRL YB-2248]
MSIKLDGDLITFQAPDSDSKAIVTKLGATLISFVVEDTEYIYLSQAANTSSDTATAIPVRGGIPIIFPAFGKSYLDSLKSLQSHGFARNLKWDFIIGEVLDDFTRVKFKLSTNNCKNYEQFKKWCDYYDTVIDFEISLVFNLFKDKVTINVDFTNFNINELEFQFLFHTYFKVPSVDDMYIIGLQNLKYIDRLAIKYKIHDSPMFKISQQTDSLFKLNDDIDSIDILSGDSNIRLTSSKNLDDLVIWNPWKDAAFKMKDFEPKESYKNMICVEFGSVEGNVVKKGQVWHCDHTINII